MKIAARKNSVNRLFANVQTVQWKQNGQSGRWIGEIGGGLAVSICLSLLSVGKANAASFSFTTIADTRSDFTSVSVPAINDSGTVAFFGTPNTGSQGIYTSSPEAITQIFNANGLPSLFGDESTSSSVVFGLPANRLDINNNNTVAFSGDRFNTSAIQGESRLFTIQDGSITTRAIASFRSSGGSNFLGFDLNDKDELAYLTSSLSQNNPSSNTDTLSISRPNQPDVNVATVFTGRPLPSDNIGTFAINNQSEVTFSAVQVKDVQSNPFSVIFSKVILRGSGGPLTTLIETGTSLNTVPNPSSQQVEVNDIGDFVLSDGNTLSKFNNANGTLTTIADTSGAFSGFGSAAINNSNTVAFTANLDSGTNGIFIGPDPVGDKVVAIGDSLLGSTVTNLFFSTKGFNNNGQIAFFAQLADGTKGIFRAEKVDTPPKSIPEPASTLGLLALSALGLSSWQKNRQPQPF